MSNRYQNWNGKTSTGRVQKWSNIKQCERYEKHDNCIKRNDTCVEESCKAWPKITLGSCSSFLQTHTKTWVRFIWWGHKRKVLDHQTTSRNQIRWWLYGQWIFLCKAPPRNSNYDTTNSNAWKLVHHQNFEFIRNTWKCDKRLWHIHCNGLCRHRLEETYELCWKCRSGRKPHNHFNVQHALCL